MKFFPAYHNYDTLKRLVVERSKEVKKPNHAKNCICRGAIIQEVTEVPAGQSVSAAETRAHTAVQPPTPAQSIPEQA